MGNNHFKEYFESNSKEIKASIDFLKEYNKLLLEYKALVESASQSFQKLTKVDLKNIYPEPERVSYLEAHKRWISRNGSAFGDAGVVGAFVGAGMTATFSLPLLAANPLAYGAAVLGSAGAGFAGGLGTYYAENPPIFNELEHPYTIYDPTKFMMPPPYSDEYIDVHSGNYQGNSYGYEEIIERYRKLNNAMFDLSSNTYSKIGDIAVNEHSDAYANINSLFDTSTDRMRSTNSSNFECMSDDYLTNMQSGFDQTRLANSDTWQGALGDTRAQMALLPGLMSDPVDQGLTDAGLLWDDV